MQGKLITELLSSAQGHIPALGFTVAAIAAGAQQTGLANTSTVSDLFPSPPATARSLLHRFDGLYWEGIARSKDGSGLKGTEEQSKAFEEAVGMVEQKLLFSAAVKSKLPDVSDSFRSLIKQELKANFALSIGSGRTHLINFTFFIADQSAQPFARLSSSLLNCR
jgi:hypothetical protein